MKIQYKDKDIRRRGRVLQDLFVRLEQKGSVAFGPLEEGLKLKVYSNRGNSSPDIVIDDSVSFVDYQGHFYRFHIGENGRVFAHCDGINQKLSTQNFSTKGMYISVPADQFGKSAEVRIGWFD